MRIDGLTDQPGSLPAQAGDGQSRRSPAQESSLGLIPVVCLLIVYEEAMATSRPNSEHLGTATTNLDAEGRKEHSTVTVKLADDNRSLVSD